MTIVLGGLAAALCCTSGVLAVALRHPLRTALSTLDARLVVEVDSDDPAVATETWRVLRERLRAADVPGKLSSAGGRKIAIDHRSQDTEAVRALVSTRGDLRFMLVVEGVSKDEVDHLLIHLMSVRRRDGTLPLDETRDVIKHGHELLVLERPGFGGPGTFKRVYRSLDAMERPAIGFDLEDDAAARFRALTGANVDRRLAIVLDGQVLSTPVIRSEIGAKGIIEGGAAGWDDVQLGHMIGVLSTEPLPARLIVVPGE
jgi:preprotein translocase subunit SecD